MRSACLMPPHPDNTSCRVQTLKTFVTQISPSTVIYFLYRQDNLFKLRSERIPIYSLRKKYQALRLKK